MVEASEGTIRKISIAPELDGALDVIRKMVKLNIVPCAAHSTATYEQAMEAVQAGLSCAAHVFNGMIPLHHCRPGLLGAVLTCDEINAELIADGQPCRCRLVVEKQRSYGDKLNTQFPGH